jgi:hypothetical protein
MDSLYPLPDGQAMNIDHSSIFHATPEITPFAAWLSLLPDSMFSIHWGPLVALEVVRLGLSK